MKNNDLWAQYDNFTKDLSENSRKLAFAGAAIAWIFKGPENTFPLLIRFSFGCIILFFIFDILQYFLGAILLKIWTEAQEKKKLQETGKIEGDYNKPRKLDKPSFRCLILKIVFLLNGYGFLGGYIFFFQAGA